MKGFCCQSLDGENRALLMRPLLAGKFPLFKKWKFCYTIGNIGKPEMLPQKDVFGGDAELKTASCRKRARLDFSRMGGGI